MTRLFKSIISTLVMLSLVAVLPAKTTVPADQVEFAIAQDSGLGVHSTPTLMSANGLRVDGYPRENPVPTIMRMLEERSK